LLKIEENPGHDIDPLVTLLATELELLTLNFPRASQPWVELGFSLDFNYKMHLKPLELLPTIRVTRLSEFSPIGRLFTLGSFF
jgi:hypothetical protein